MQKNQELKNKFTLYKIVKNHFSLTKESLDLFKFRLFYEPHIATEYSEILKRFSSKDDPLRARIPIPRESQLMAKLDKGWGIFKDYFSVFINNHNISYSDFVNNKVLIDKQQVKLMKAVTKFYSKDIENVHNYYRITPERIQKIFEEIGKHKITKKGVELVLSLNFADWFLCSTGENWGSCLSLESGYEDAYWSGLPGLVGDKNRAMLYITSGEKKEYEGIIVDKVLSRSWTLILRKRASVDEKEKRSDTSILVVGEYPNSFGLAKLAETFFSEMFNGRDFFSERKHISRYYIENLFHEDHGNYKNCFTSYIYQDNTINIIGKKNKASFREGAYSYLKYGQCGINRFNKNGKAYNGEYFYYGGGLRELIRTGVNISQAYDIEPKYHCDNCGEPINENEIYWYDDTPYCEYCFNDAFTVCHSCGETVCNDDAIYIESEGVYVCEVCHEQYYFECEECGCSYPKRDEVYIENKNISICRKCYRNNNLFYVCEECNGIFEKDGSEIYVEDKNEYLCSNTCHEKYYNIKYVKILEEEKRAS